MVSATADSGRPIRIRPPNSGKRFEVRPRASFGRPGTGYGKSAPSIRARSTFVSITGIEPGAPLQNRGLHPGARFSSANRSLRRFRPGPRSLATASRWLGRARHCALTLAESPYNWPFKAQMPVAAVVRAIDAPLRADAAARRPTRLSFQAGSHPITLFPIAICRATVRVTSSGQKHSI